MKLVFDLDNEKAKVNFKKCRVIFNRGTDASLSTQNDIRIESEPSHKVFSPLFE